MTRTRALFWMVLVLLGAWAIRWAAVTGPLSTLESDESVAGLMALGILRGERPVFYWGQPYLGAIEMYLTAAVFFVAGSSPFTFKFVPVAASVLFVATTYQVGRQYFNRQVGLLSAALASVALLLVIRGVKGTGYGPVLVLGNLALLQIAHYHRNRESAPSRQNALRLGLLGVTGGLLFWAHPMGLVYIVPILGWLAQCELSLAHSRHLSSSTWLPSAVTGFLVLAAGSALGMLPLLWENAHTGWQTFGLLGGAGASSTDWLARILDFRMTFPLLLGFLQPTSNVAAFWDQVAARPLAYWTGLALGAGLVLWLLLELLGAAWHFARTRETRPAWVLLYTFAATCVFTIASRFSSFTEPRYLLPLYSCTPFFVGRIAQMRFRRFTVTPAQLLGLGLPLLLVNLIGLATLSPNLNLPYLEGRPYPADLRPTITRLQNAKADAVYADYWICYRLMFETNEAVQCSVIDGVDSGWNRHSPYAAAVQAAPDPAWIFVAASRFDLEFQRALDGRRAKYLRTESGGYSLYLDVNPRLYPGQVNAR
jgi:hypothetical protein